MTGHDFKAKTHGINNLIIVNAIKKNKKLLVRYQFKIGPHTYSTKKVETILFEDVEQWIREKRTIAESIKY